MQYRPVVCWVLRVNCGLFNLRLMVSSWNLSPPKLVTSEERAVMLEEAQNRYLLRVSCCIWHKQNKRRRAVYYVTLVIANCYFQKGCFGKQEKRCELPLNLRNSEMPQPARYIYTRSSKARAGWAWTWGWLPALSVVSVCLLAHGNVTELRLLALVPECAGLFVSMNPRKWSTISWMAWSFMCLNITLASLLQTKIHWGQLRDV